MLFFNDKSQFKQKYTSLTIWEKSFIGFLLTINVIFFFFQGPFIFFVHICAEAIMFFF